MINLEQYEKHVLRPVLETMGMVSENAVQLMIGTALQESRFEYLVQLEEGPAVGFFQMEPATSEDIMYRYVQNKDHHFRDMVQTASQLVSPWNLSPAALRLHVLSNLRLQVVLARLKYYMVPAAIPDTLAGQSKYWKQYYNTPLGAGTADEYMENYINQFGDE